MTLMCSSWTRSEYRPAGVTMATSVPDSSGEPGRPTNATVRMPIALAVDAAARTLGLFPLVLMPTKRSPDRPWASRNRANTCSYAIVVGDAREQPRVADRDRRQCPTIVTKPARQFLCQMHGIAHRAAIAGGNDLASSVERLHQRSRHLLDAIEDLGVASQCVQCLGRITQGGVDDGPHCSSRPSIS